MDNQSIKGLFGSYLRICEYIGRTVLTALVGGSALRGGDAAEIVRTIFGSVLVGTAVGSWLGVLLVLALGPSAIGLAVLATVSGGVLLGAFPAGALLMVGTYF